MNGPALLYTYFSTDNFTTWKNQRTLNTKKICLGYLWSYVVVAIASSLCIPCPDTLTRAKEILTNFPVARQELHISISRPWSGLRGLSLTHYRPIHTNATKYAKRGSWAFEKFWQIRLILIQERVAWGHPNHILILGRAENVNTNNALRPGTNNSYSSNNSMSDTRSKSII